MLIASVESFMDNKAELELLFPKHWEELALNKDKVPLNPDWKRYKAIEDSGILSFIGLRQDGKLVGYFVGIIMPHLHYTTCNTYIMDMLYVAKEARNKNAGILIMRTMEKEAKRRGVQRIVLNTKIHMNIGSLYHYMGFECIETIWSKWIGE